LVTVLLVVSFGVIVVFSNSQQQSRAEQEMLEKARVLSQQMNAVWDFIEINQDVIDTDSDGSYNFKGIYCAIVGKSIAVRFSQETDYKIRYTSTNPRKNSALPDDFESRAFVLLNSGQTEFYGIVTYEGEEAFRYVTPLHVEESCLNCHGEPAGEIDLTGYPKEGLKVGDIGGAISIIVPIQDYMASIRSDITTQTIFISAIVLLVMLILYFAVSRMIMKPLTQLRETASEIQNGNLSVKPREIQAVGEIYDLAGQFDTMTRRLQSLYEDLEDQVTARTKQLEDTNEVLKQQQTALEQMNLKLQNESEYKSDFLAIMSHELRTPLTSILAYAEMWESSPVNRSVEEYEAVREIKENGQFLLQMVNNILEAARFEAGKEEISLEEVDMVDLYGVVHDSVGFIADKRSIDFKTEIAPDVPIFMGDWNKLRRILENLISNAIKYTVKGGRVSITATYDAKMTAVVMKVCDTGIGIKPENLANIFERFTQSDFSSYRRYNGSGLGLAVVKDLVLLLGGSIEVESTYYQGSTFTVRIPTNVYADTLVDNTARDPMSLNSNDQEGGQNDEDHVGG
jgi:signal transduction histidine kinase